MVADSVRQRAWALEYWRSVCFNKAWSLSTRRTWTSLRRLTAGMGLRVPVVCTCAITCSQSLNKRLVKTKQKPSFTTELVFCLSPETPPYNLSRGPGSMSRSKIELPLFRCAGGGHGELYRYGYGSVRLSELRVPNQPSVQKVPVILSHVHQSWQRDRPLFCLCGKYL